MGPATLTRLGCDSPPATGLTPPTVAILVFLSLVIQYFVCYYRNHPVRKNTVSTRDDGTLVPKTFTLDKKLRKLSIAISLVTFHLLVRCVTSSKSQRG